MNYEGGSAGGGGEARRGHEQLTGRQLGPYQILGTIGTGVMGPMYRARDIRSQREVAIKIVLPSITADKEILKRFEREARAASALNHPNILTIYDFAESEGLVFYVTERLEGETLRQQLTRGKLEPYKAIKYATQIVEAVSVAHRSGILHRDLKPENIFITKDERVKIMDFGLSKLFGIDTFSGKLTNPETIPQLTRRGLTIGTAAYMSPEQVSGKSVDFRSDIFSFGAILYEMLTGEPAFENKSAAETFNSILAKDPPLEKIPTEFRTIIQQCLAKDPDNRLKSTNDLLDKLRDVKIGESISIPKDIDKRIKSKAKLTSLWGVRVSLLLVVCSIAFAVVSTNEAFRSAIAPRMWIFMIAIPLATGFMLQWAWRLLSLKK